MHEIKFLHVGKEVICHLPVFQCIKRCPMLRYILLVISLSISSATMAFDFKGVVLGESSTPETIKEKLGVECGQGLGEMKICNGYVTIAEQGANMNLLINENGIVQRINFILSSDSFEVVQAALSEKFGKPTTSRKEAMQNGFGAQFQNEIYIWKEKNGNEVNYQKYGINAEKSTLNFTTKEDREFLNNLSKKRKSDL